MPIPFLLNLFFHSFPSHIPRSWLPLPIISPLFSLFPIGLSFLLVSPCAVHLCGAPFFSCCCCCFCCYCSLKLMPGISGSRGRKRKHTGSGDQCKRRREEAMLHLRVWACACAWVGSMQIPGLLLRWCWWCWCCCCGAAAALWWGLAEAGRWQERAVAVGAATAAARGVVAPAA